MKLFVLAVALFVAAAPARAQFGALDKLKKGVDTARDFVIPEKDERTIGEQVSQKVRTEFGVVQDKAVTKYVTLVGSVMTQASSRPDLKWEFIVLDTDGVNAFAAPGGIVHITRGALGLIKSEAELAGVLAHEIAHITKKHTINSIRKNKTAKFASDVTPGSNAYFEAIANAAYDNIVEKGFDRGDEQDADAEGIRIANKAGYNPIGLATFLRKLADRNTGVPTRNGLFASHPETNDRISKIEKQIKSEKLAATALADTRYAASIKYQAKPLTEVATIMAGTKGVAGDSGSKDAKTDKDKKAESGSAPKSSGGGFGAFAKQTLSGGKQVESTQASASAGGRAVGVDRHAKGGDNPNKVSVAVTPAEVAEFKKGIA